MAQALKKIEHVEFYARCPMKQAMPLPVSGSHAKQINDAFIVVFAQYEKAFEELAKV